jgi:lipopolysaccharide transport system permease protein
MLARAAALDPAAFLRSGWRHRRLVLQLARGRIESRYRGSMLGLLWVLVLPLLMLGVYTFVFSVVLRARWGVSAAGDVPFALLIFSGLLVYGLFAECAAEAPALLHAHQAFFKQVVFPGEVLAWVSLLAAGLPFLASLALLLLAHVLWLGIPPPTVLWLPVLLLPVVLLTLGSVWILSSLGVFLRDLSQFVSVAISAGLFLSPIFYPASRVPEPFQPLLALNPFTPVLEGWRRALFEGAAPDWTALGVATACAWVVAWLGHAWFVRAQRSFADVL